MPEHYAIEIDREHQKQNFDQYTLRNPGENRKALNRVGYLFKSF